MTEEPTYWTHLGLLRSVTWEDDQNGLLRLAYYHLKQKRIGVHRYDEHLEKATLAIAIMHDGDGRYAQHPDTRWDLDRASHDEMTAITYFISHYDDGLLEATLLEDIKLGYYAKYIQIIFYLLAIKYRSKIALWIACLIVYLGVRTKEKAANGRWDTDSELLALLKIDTIERVFGAMPLKDKILSKIREHWGQDYMKTLIDEMLWHAPDHPLRTDIKHNDS